MILKTLNIKCGDSWLEGVFPLADGKDQLRCQEIMTRLYRLPAARVFPSSN